MAARFSRTRLGAGSEGSRRPRRTGRRLRVRWCDERGARPTIESGREVRRRDRRGRRNRTFVLEAGEGEAIAATDSGLLEDVLQVDLHGSGLDAELTGDIAIAQTFFDEHHHLALAVGQLRPL